MTPDQLQSEIDNLTADASRCLQDGERRAASMLTSVAKRLQSHMPVKAPSAPVEAAPAPEPTPEPPKGSFGPGAVDRGGKPLKKRRKKD